MRVRVLLLHQIVKLVNVTYYLAIGSHMLLFVIEKIDCLEAFWVCFPVCYSQGKILIVLS